MERLLSAGKLTEVNKGWNVFTKGGPPTAQGGHLVERYGSVLCAHERLHAMV